VRTGIENFASIRRACKQRTELARNEKPRTIHEKYAESLEPLGGHRNGSRVRLLIPEALRSESAVRFEKSRGRLTLLYFDTHHGLNTTIRDGELIRLLLKQ
jgi:hypothetical protein